MRKPFFALVAFWSIVCPMRAGQDPQAKPAQADKVAPGKEAAPVGKAQDKPPLVGGAPIDPKTYVIGPEDVLVVRVWREPEISGQVVVRPDGKISMQLLNEMQAAGLTPERLSANITEGLSKFYTHPEVTVAVTTVNSRKYFIIGEVQKTGSFPLVVPTTVMEALVNAGGFRDFAKTKKIMIIRGTQRFKFNYKEVIEGKKLEQNILLQPGDQIVVP